MPTWGNTDNHNQKPKFDVVRETREVLQFTIRTGNTAGNNVIQVAYNDGAQNNVANVGAAVGQWVYFYALGANNVGGLSGNGTPGFFESNTQISTISGNTITLSNNLFGPANAGWTVEFDKAIAYNSNKTVETTYNSDTILMTATRCANTSTNLPTGITAAQVGNMTQGWVHVQKKVNADGTVRYLKETLVALANATASNTSSANTSFGNFIAGV